MVEPRFAALAADLENELRQIDALLEELAMLRSGLPDPPTSLDLRAAGSILHDFYRGAERMFQRIAGALDRDVPTDPNWHVELLQRMGYAISGVRPALVSSDLRERLSDYLRFRHLFRNVYGRSLRWELMRVLIDELPDLHNQFRNEVGDFLRFLNGLAGGA